jgi:CheY-like chemotaxis protein
MSNRTILIVDDCIVFLKAMSMKLRGHGYDVVTAVDGAAAVSAVRQVKPDLILLDLNFPPDVAHGGGVAWDGYLIMNWLRRIDDARNAPIIVITASDANHDREKMRAAGVVDFFLKPVDNDELLSAIERALLAVPEVQRAPIAQSSGKVLFVDDENDWCYMATLYLKECGYEVVTAGDGTEALARASKMKPDLIVLDLNLGGQSGDTLMKLLVVTYPQTPVLVYTGKELDEATVQDLLEQGAYRCLRKGTMEELLEGVSEAMSEPAPPPESNVTPDPEPRELPTQSRAESVLLLEDDIAFGDTLLVFLESQGLCVTRVTDGVEGLRQVIATDFDFILCDMAMPNMPGDQFYQELEQIKPELCKRFIFMTGHHADPRSDTFVRRVHALMLWKPFPLADLVTATGIVRRRQGEVVERLTVLRLHPSAEAHQPSPQPRLSQVSSAPVRSKPPVAGVEPPFLSGPL